MEFQRKGSTGSRFFAQESVLEKYRFFVLTFTDFQTGRQKVSKPDFQSQF